MKIAAKILSTVNGRLSTVLILAFLFSLFALTLTFAPTAHAQSPDALQARDAAVKRDIVSITNGLTEMILGTHGQGGAISAIGSLTASLYASPPASGIAFFHDEIQRFNPLKPAYAQTGIGYSLLNPVQKIWTVFRNVSYIGFVLVFVIIGFMIMFRAHISPQAVATIQDSLPRVVIALVLVTFSYAIAGLMIDLMLVILNVFINVLSPAGGTLLDPAKARGLVFENSIFDLAIPNLKLAFEAASSGVQQLINDLLGGGFASNFVSFLAGGLFGIIAAIAILFITIRIFLQLLMAYITIVILTMFAPFFFLIQALPGNNGAKTWFKQMAANIAIFPAVAIMILLAGLIAGLTDFGAQSGSLFDNTQIGSFPLLSNTIGTGAIGNLIALGFLLMTPEIGKIIKSFFGAQGAPGFGGIGAGVGATLGAGAGALAAAGKRTGHEAWTSPYSPIGARRREIEARRGERAQIIARKSMSTKPPRGLTQEDIQEYGIGYKQKPQ